MLPIRQYLRPPGNMTPSRMRNQHPQIATEFTIIRNTPKRKQIVSPMKIQNKNRVIIKNNNLENQRNYFSNQNMVETDRCPNHYDKLGKYYVQINGQVLAYCDKCSAHFASRGFHVQKVNQIEKVHIVNQRQTQTSQIDQFKKAQKYLGSDIINNPRMRQLKGFIWQSEKLKIQFNQNVEIFQDIPNHYNEQTQMIQQFYDTMVLFINSLRNQHRSLLEAENKRYCQLAEVMAVQLQQTNAELENILEDIVTNINDIVVGISQQRYRDSINYYLQKIEFFKGRVDQQKMSFQEVTSVEQGQLKGLIQQFKVSVNNILGIKDLTKQIIHNFKQPTEQQMPILKKINNQYKTQPHPQARDPFRTLFSQQEHQPEQSPHFKVI